MSQFLLFFCLMAELKRVQRIPAGDDQNRLSFNIIDVSICQLKFDISTCDVTPCCFAGGLKGALNNKKADHQIVVRTLAIIRLAKF